MKNFFQLLVITASLIGATVACGSTTDPNSVRRIQATVCYSQINGGSYALCADDKLTYEPVDLEEQFKENGLRINARVRLLPDTMTPDQRGIVVEVLEIQRL
jgi:hypothetical protein